MEFFGENFIFEIRVFSKIEIYSVAWLNIFKFCPLNSCQITQRPSSSSPSSTHLWMADEHRHPQTWDPGDQFWPLLKTWWWRLLHFDSTSKTGSLASSLSLSLSFCTSSICSTASCFSPSPFCTCWQVDVSSSLGAGGSLYFFLPGGGSDDWHLGAVLQGQSTKQAQTHVWKELWLLSVFSWVNTGHCFFLGICSFQQRFQMLLWSRSFHLFQADLLCPLLYQSCHHSGENSLDWCLKWERHKDPKYSG